MCPRNAFVPGSTVVGDVIKMGHQTDQLYTGAKYYNLPSVLYLPMVVSMWSNRKLDIP